MRQVGIDTHSMEVTLHDLRKSCIQNWANVLPMNVVKELAGHSSITKTTKFCNKITSEHMKATKRVGENPLEVDLTDHKLTISGISEQISSEL